MTMQLCPRLAFGFANTPKSHEWRERQIGVAVLGAAFAAMRGDAASLRIAAAVSCN